MSDKIDNMISGAADFRGNIYNYVVELLVDNADEILQQVKNQLFEGIGGDGMPLEPTYVNDSYFKTLGGVERYLIWKEKFSGIPLPSNGSPNLYVDGTFHNSMYVDLVDDGVKVTSSRENDIMAKWGVGKFAPTDEWMNAEIREPLIDKLTAKLRESLTI